MLHDLYLLSCYFDPASAAQYETDLRRRYGAAAVEKALAAGHLVRRSLPPCGRAADRLVWLSEKGMSALKNV